MSQILTVISNSLQTPVVALLLLLGVAALANLGMLIAEYVTERRCFTLSLPQLVRNLRERENAPTVILACGLLQHQKNILLELLSHPQASDNVRESLAVSLVADEQRRFDVRVKVTDLIAKVSPMVGLMGTLIPLGPGLMALGSGNTEILSQSLLLAFNTTIVGLAIAAVALLISTVRKHWYATYMTGFESAVECVLDLAKDHQEFDVPVLPFDGKKEL